MGQNPSIPKGKSGRIEEFAGFFCIKPGQADNIR